jgi:hypothetical protein
MDVDAIQVTDGAGAWKRERDRDIDSACMTDSDIAGNERGVEFERYGQFVINLHAKGLHPPTCNPRSSSTSSRVYHGRTA